MGSENGWKEIELGDSAIEIIDGDRGKSYPNGTFKEGELGKDSVVKEYLTTASDGKEYKTQYYKLDVIISKQAKIKAELESEKYQAKNKDELSKVEEDFLESIKETQKMLEGKG